ncbi:hypothetical protein [Pseudomonas aeruginosa]|uniref:hypothetical protein n=2 Tax=Pseudomonas TaxID=286 RepID=UPI0011E5F87A|nr:hypothetical protein [Pseudomonas aeruginosa]
MDQLVSDLAEKIADLKSDRDVIDKAIAETKGVLADGETRVRIETTGMVTQRSEAHLQEIAKTVEGIVNNIVLADDEKQLCMSALLLPTPNEGQKKFSDWCLKVMDTQAEAKDYLMKDIKRKTEQAQAILQSNASADKKEEARNEINDLKEEAKEIGRGTGIYSVAKEIM